eukprot:Gb_22720 [translate_table: standard]
MLRPCCILLPIGGQLFDVERTRAFNLVEVRRLLMESNAPSLDKTIAIGGANMDLSRAFIKDVKKARTPTVGSAATGNMIPMMTSIAQPSTPTSPMPSLHIIGSPSHRAAEPVASVNQSLVNGVVYLFTTQA